MPKRLSIRLQKEDVCVNLICIQKVYMYTPLRSNMAKLYWRIKKNGKWTWQPAVVLRFEDGCWLVDPLMEEEE